MQACGRSDSFHFWRTFFPEGYLVEGRRNQPDLSDIKKASQTSAGLRERGYAWLAEAGRSQVKMICRSRQELDPRIGKKSSVSSARSARRIELPRDERMLMA